MPAHRHHGQGPGGADGATAELLDAELLEAHGLETPWQEAPRLMVSDPFLEEELVPELTRHVAVLIDMAVPQPLSSLLAGGRAYRRLPPGL